jgi:hypothetical protein
MHFGASAIAMAAASFVGRQLLGVLLFSLLSAVMAGWRVRRAAPAVVPAAPAANAADWRQAATSWAPPFSLYIAFAFIGSAILWQTLQPSAKPIKGKRGAPPPPPPKEKDHVDPSLALAAHAYSGYAYLFLRGYTLDFLQVVVSVVCFWRKLGGGAARDSRAGPPISAKYGPPFNSGWVIFYTRRLYARIEDCWNRPIAGEASSSIDVCMRERDGSGDLAPLVRTGATRHCLNLGSYNYLGFGGLDPICTPAVKRALRTYGVSACSSRMEAGSTAVHAELEDTVANFLEKPAAVVIGMGFATNSFVIPVLVDPDGCATLLDRPARPTLTVGLVVALQPTLRCVGTGAAAAAFVGALAAHRTTAAAEDVGWAGVLISIRMCRACWVLVCVRSQGKGVLLLSDALNHSSIVEGVRGSGAKVQPFAHNNMEHLEAILKHATDHGQPSGVRLQRPTATASAPPARPTQPRRTGTRRRATPTARADGGLRVARCGRRRGARSLSSSRASIRWRASSPSCARSLPSRKSTTSTCTSTRLTRSARWGRVGAASPTTSASTRPTST